MKHIILILILIPLLIFAGDTPLPDKNEAGEPITPDYTSWQKDVKAAMMDLRDVSDDFFQETEQGGYAAVFPVSDKKL